jgi:hypothetical protein
MNVNLTISVDHPEELPRVLQHLARSFAGVTTAAEVGSAVTEAAVEAAKPRRGRPAKNAELPEPPAAEPEVLDMPAVPQVAAAAPAAPGLEKKDVQKLLIAVVQKHGVAACSEICMKHGGPNLSALDPSTYPSVVADAQAKLATEAAA